ncbi:MAG TPA: hypothetical protein VGB67_10265 [Fibrella sp.]|jgi:hypothetical protein
MATKIIISLRAIRTSIDKLIDAEERKETPKPAAKKPVTKKTTVKKTAGKTSTKKK